jgi:hypothetical protein
MMMRLMGDIHPIGYNTFVVVTMTIAPVPCLSIVFNHVILKVVANLVKMP